MAIKERSRGVAELIPDPIRRELRSRLIDLRMRWYLATSDSQPEAYRRLMQYRVRKHGPMAAVGGDQHRMGRWQLGFLKDHGLQPHHHLFDLGCGALRFGRHAIDYLDAGHYTGMDISAEAIDAGRGALDDEVVEEADPTLVVNDDLRFREPELRTDYDFIIANSVFTHLDEPAIVECLQHLNRPLAPDGVCYATYFDGEMQSSKDYGYSYDHLASLAADAGLEARLLYPKMTPHPRGQHILELRRTGQTLAEMDHSHKLIQANND